MAECNAQPAMEYLTNVPTLIYLYDSEKGICSTVDFIY